ncbi:hypothetical protein AC578_6130 [Pseudocercospora eumusae]|uniref:Uncharacterized protein n=1 Tax=Pseudocercospora eumusae TaxID=321146 RepID=A0A139GXN0_9PEZI|nr:hypothetical protein AC578_6130 [Pseudocercospora eumusae]
MKHQNSHQKLRITDFFHPHKKSPTIHPKVSNPSLQEISTRTTDIPNREPTTTTHQKRKHAGSQVLNESSNQKSGEGSASKSSARQNRNSSLEEDPDDGTSDDDSSSLFTIADSLLDVDESRFDRSNAPSPSSIAADGVKTGDIDRSTAASQTSDGVLSQRKRDRVVARIHDLLRNDLRQG